MGLLAHAARRGLTHVAKRSFTINGQDAPKFEAPKWGIAVITLTIIGMFVLMASIEYTLKNVIATLAMIDSPSTTITVNARESESLMGDSKKEEALEVQPISQTITTKPITSSIRKTLRHLRAEAGWFSRFRGFVPFAAYTGAFFLIANIIEAILPRFPGAEILISALTGALVAPLHAAWTHKVISLPTDKKIRGLVPARSTWRALWLPAAIQNSVMYLSIYVLAASIILMGVTDFDFMNSDTLPSWLSVSLRVLAVLFLGLFLAMFVVLPSTVTLIRIEASLLPEDTDTIVPFDRTFGGKVVPRVLGGTGAVSFVDAWRSFNWEARRRVLKLYVKITAVMTALTFVFVHIVALEMWVIMGTALKKWFEEVDRRGLLEQGGF